MIMRKVIVLLIVVIGICCKDQKNPGTKLEEEFVIPQVFLNEDINRELQDWIAWVSTEIDSISGWELCYTVEFFLDSMYTRPLGKDTVIVLSYYTPLDDYPGFKGIASTGVNFVAVVDKNSVGERYYDSQLLRAQPLNSFKGGPTVAGRRAVGLFKLKNGKLTSVNRLDRL